MMDSTLNPEWEPTCFPYAIFYDPPTPPIPFLSTPELDEYCPLEQAQSGEETGPRGRYCKAEKVRPIRTSRNVQKMYHNILKKWLLANRLESIANKYNQYFNQRIYLVLVLQEILKNIDGSLFLRAYQEQTADLGKKKEHKMRAYQQDQGGYQKIEHLRRVIQEVEFSVAACREFIEGNTLEAITIVYQRTQKKITKVKEFKAALNIFEAEAGYAPENL